MDTSEIARHDDCDDIYIPTPAETIRDMFAHTDGSGTLYIREWPRDDSYNEEKERFFRCTMNWTQADAEKLIAEFDALYKALEKIADRWDSEKEEYNVDALSDEVREVWHTYVREFEIGDIDVSPVADISERMVWTAEVRSIAEEMKAGAKLSKEEKDLYRKFKDTTVTEEEEALYDAYRKAVHADAERRVGGGCAAYDVVIRAMRLCKLLALGASEILIRNESQLLAQALAIHRFCGRMEVADNAE